MKRCKDSVVKEVVCATVCVCVGVCVCYWVVGGGCCFIFKFIILCEPTKKNKKKEVVF